jgi:hypothetical protein
MIIKIETEFAKGEEITHTFELSEEAVRKIVMEHLNNKTYKERREFLDQIHALKIS